MGLECDGSEVVIRFSPFGADRLRENAEDTYVDDLTREDHRDSPRYGVSVIAGWCLDDEDMSTAIARITGRTTLNGKTIAVLTGSELRRQGFEVVEDFTEKEPQHHLVGDHPFTEVPRVDVLASLLENRRMRNPAWGRRGAA